MAERVLRIGIVCHGPQLLHWQAECVRELQRVTGVELTLVLETRPPSRGNTSILYRWWLQRPSRTSALRMEDGAAVLEGLHRIKATDRSEADLLQELEPYRLDILLQFTAGELPAPLLQLPRSGVWRIHHGDTTGQVQGVPGLWEAFHDSRSTVAKLVRLTEAGGSVLRSGRFPTFLGSIDATAGGVLLCCSLWPAQVCRALLAGDADAAAGADAGPIARANRQPGNVEMLRVLLKQGAGKRLAKASAESTSEEWNIGVLPHPVGTLLKDEPSLNVRWLPPPAAGQYRSTPFGLVDQGRLNVLYEKFDLKMGKGLIGRLRPKKDNNLKRSRTVLESDGSLSYPFIVEQGGAILAVPEQVSTGRVDLYLLDEDRSSLTFVSTLLQEGLYSPTLFEHDGRWWLFGTLAPLEDAMLCAYHADRLEGPYTAHLLNPIKVDLASSRPAGTPFRYEGQLWRPARDGSISPGGRIALNHVTELSPTRFHEEPVKYIEPLKGPWSHGLRTLSKVGDITLVDGMRSPTGKTKRKAGNKASKKRGTKSVRDHQ
ncbi:MAG: hypothetical protein K8H89_15920 [Flavobacteriales bacterium]|nr:hypothetical protein [Flavobacteriales bacterium]